MSDYQSVGFTKKTYGVKGELKVNIPDNYLEDFAQAEVLFLGLAGRKIPYFIEYINFENLNQKYHQQLATNCVQFYLDQVHHHFQIIHQL